MKRVIFVSVKVVTVSSWYDQCDTSSIIDLVSYKINTIINKLYKIDTEYCR